MKNLRVKSIIFSLALFLFFNLSAASGWHDETHLAVAKAAGYSRWYNAAGPDITKIKADFIERNNHYFDNEKDVLVTARTVLAQISRYNSPTDSEGHLYGAIIASLREYEKTVKAGKYPEYHVAFCAHYIGDLSQPLHNTPYDAFNKKHHSVNDGTVENEVLKNISLLEKNIYPANLRPEHFEEDLAGEIARIANISRTLGHKLRKENRDMTREEAYVQLGHSASLLKAVLKHIGKID